VRPRVLAGLWLVVGIAVWNGFLDLYVSRGAREYGQKKAEADLGQGPQVTMTDVMTSTTHDGVVAGTLWAAGIVFCGWTTIWLASRGGRTQNPEPRTRKTE